MRSKFERICSLYQNFPEAIDDQYLYVLEIRSNIHITCEVARWAMLRLGKLPSLPFEYVFNLAYLTASRMLANDYLAFLRTYSGQHGPDTSALLGPSIEAGMQPDFLIPSQALSKAKEPQVHQ
ncbi:hypothetical protein CIHG_09713 [Coccidioides immitis H538.4]|uniref:Uncharacterized protein n=3 Tax=Coccidioides immitis TaxID=5501 RepID=A0A0J8QVL6_COCIT|nr:hypothetical protein CIRG_09707 [Coccidioides immitis RMSCC 2394]KMU76904.1 hypothetical protein CISG_05945 [Coccidioides immitis RMSCC 3703]KMU91933.1 hypothetical protein CIHG_09713 [Coccidioides immitis H538.4]